MSPRLHLHPFSRHSRGAALIAVLSVLGLLTVLALGTLSAARRHAQLAQTADLLIQQRELADSALRLSVLELSASNRRIVTTGLGRRSVDLLGKSITVVAQRESGRIDLNYASESLLVAAFAGNGLEENEARRLAARVIDWRDVDDIADSQGAERNDYRSANRIGPRNAPFERVDELLLVLGAEPLSASVLDAFTVYSHVAEVREDAAPPAVMMALRWAQARRLDGHGWFSEAVTAAGSAQQRALDGEVLRLQACTAPLPVEVCRTVVFRLTGDRSNPALVFAWF